MTAFKWAAAGMAAAPAFGSRFGSRSTVRGLARPHAESRPEVLPPRSVGWQKLNGGEGGIARGRGRPLVLRFAPGPSRLGRDVQKSLCDFCRTRVGSSTHSAPPIKKGLKNRPFLLAERVGFEPTCRNYPTIRFRVGAVVTTSVPLQLT